MIEMPLRPREHVLADKAEDAFQALLPEEWIYRPKATDYGVDGEVELVSPGGQLTGRLFYVQLKGTDSNSAEEVLSVRLKIRTINYFRALDLPVLIVRYDAPKETLYARWFESVSSSLPDAGQETAVVKLSGADELRSARSEKLGTELENIRLVKFNKVTLPVAVTLTFSGGPVQGFAAAEFISVAKQVLGDGFVEFKDDAPIGIDVRGERAHIRIGMAPESEIPLAAPPTGGALETLAANVITALGIELSRLGQRHAGAALIASSAQSGDLLKTSVPYGIEAAFCLAADDRAAEALSLADIGLREIDSPELAQIMALVPLLVRSRSGSTRELHTAVLRRIAAESERRGSTSLHATACYNLANHLNAAGCKREALRLYRAALLADKRYGERGYFWRELGVLLFDKERFRASAMCYRRAIALGEDECRPLLADALTSMGEYDQAIQGFEDYLKGGEEAPSEWILKSLFVRMLRDELGTGTQQRSRRLALIRATPHENGFGAAQFGDAIRADALCGLAWFNRACLELKKGAFEDAAKCFLAAALCQGNDLQAWCSAVACALNAHRLDLAAHVMSAGYRRLGERLAQALFQFVKEQPSQFPKDKMIEAIGAILSAVKQKPDLGTTLRLFPGASGGGQRVVLGKSSP